MLVPLLIFIALSLLIYAGFLKLAARVLRYSVTWKSTLLFAVIMVIALNIARALNLGEPFAITIGHHIVVLFGLLIFGSWFFSARGRSRSGTVLGWDGGAKFVGLGFAMMIVVGLLIVLPLQIFLTKHLPPPH